MGYLETVSYPSFVGCMHKWILILECRHIQNQPVQYATAGYCSMDGFNSIPDDLLDSLHVRLF